MTIPLFFILIAVIVSTPTMEQPVRDAIAFTAFVAAILSAMYGA